MTQTLMKAVNITEENQNCMLVDNKHEINVMTERRTEKRRN